MFSEECKYVVKEKKILIEIPSDSYQENSDEKNHNKENSDEENSKENKRCRKFEKYITIKKKL